jgi:hypothetical protein
MNNLLSYCGLVDVRIIGSDKDLPVRKQKTKPPKTRQTTKLQKSKTQKKQKNETKWKTKKMFSATALR